MALALVLNRRRQVPAEDSPGFGAIAERFRRAGELDRAVALCQEGLRKYPKHLSSRVTLGWALLDLGRYEEARVELEQVLKRAPDNLAAIRGLAQLHDRTEHDDVASMQTGPSQWAPPDVPVDESDETHYFGEVRAEEAADHAFNTTPGPWMTLDSALDGAPVDSAVLETPAVDAEFPLHEESLDPPMPPAYPAEDLAADTLAAALLRAAPHEPLFADEAMHVEDLSPGELASHELAALPDHEIASAIAPFPSLVASADTVVDPPLAIDHQLRESEGLDGPWCNEGLDLGRPEPEAAPPVWLEPSPAPVDDSADDIVPYEGPGPWPPPLELLEAAEASPAREPLRLAHRTDDAWPPLERRPIRCVVATAPSVPGSAYSTTVKRSNPTLVSKLRKFGRRVESRRKTIVSEFVAG